MIWSLFYRIQKAFWLGQTGSLPEESICRNVEGMNFQVGFEARKAGLFGSRTFFGRPGNGHSASFCPQACWKLMGGSSAPVAEPELTLLGGGFRFHSDLAGSARGPPRVADPAPSLAACSWNSSGRGWDPVWGAVEEALELWTVARELPTRKSDTPSILPTTATSLKTLQKPCILLPIFYLPTAPKPGHPPPSQRP